MRIKETIIIIIIIIIITLRMSGNWIFTFLRALTSSYLSTTNSTCMENKLSYCDLVPLLRTIS